MFYKHVNDRLCGFSDLRRIPGNSKLRPVFRPSRGILETSEQFTQAGVFSLASVKKLQPEHTNLQLNLIRCLHPKITRASCATRIKKGLLMGEFPKAVDRYESRLKESCAENRLATILPFTPQQQ